MILLIALGIVVVSYYRDNRNRSAFINKRGKGSLQTEISKVFLLIFGSILCRASVMEAQKKLVIDGQQEREELLTKEKQTHEDLIHSIFPKVPLGLLMSCCLVFADFSLSLSLR